MEEQWKTVKGFEDYQVSNLGKVKSFKCGEEKILKGSVDGGGYYQVGLRKNGKTFIKKVHQLVAIAFLNHEPCGHKLVIDHINGWKIDNRLKNLQIVTQKFNINKSIQELKIITPRPFYAEIIKHLVWSDKINKWILLLRCKGKQIYLNYFDTELEASQSYQNELKKIKL